eukprot:NODE_125_length_17255_cov_0.877827.p6 type:complete len:256 gc:universal NODE_125_length_17255_cov_0.877827:1515-748(-)
MLQIQEFLSQELDQTFVGGIDEAGRGPVIGSMVYCLALQPIDYEWPENIDDSKKLDADTRQHILKELKINYYLVSISPEYISEHMLKGISLNEIALEATNILLEKVKDLKISCIYVDTLGHAKHHQLRLEKLTKHKVVVESKADTKYKPVMGASICAKVYRDSLIEEGMGSGYPSDPNTIKYMKSVHNLFGYPNHVRFSWKTAQEHTRKLSIKFENESSEVMPKMLEKGQMKLNFFGSQQIKCNYNIKKDMIKFC